jgi:parvulin-like peptidyl-prolyl isomerase
MDARIFLFSCLLTASVAFAQVNPDKPAVPPTPAPQAQKSPGDVITELTREKERLEKEIEFAKERQGSAKKDLAGKLGGRGQQLRAVRFEAPKPVMPVSQPMKKARVMSDAEREAAGGDVLMVVNGEPIRRGHMDLLMNYLQSAKVPGDLSQHAQRVAFELIRNTAVHAAFPENAAEGRMADALGAVQQGKKVQDLIAEYATVPGAAADGTLEVTRNSFLGVQFEQVAFSLEPGQYSRPFLNPQGYVILQAIERKKADDGSESVKVAALQIPYQANADELRAAQAAPAMGQIDIMVRDAAVLDMLPALFRPTAVPTVPATDKIATDGDVDAPGSAKHVEAIEEAKKVAPVKKVDVVKPGGGDR